MKSKSEFAYSQYTISLSILTDLFKTIIKKHFSYFLIEYQPVSAFIHSSMVFNNLTLFNRIYIIGL